MMRRYRSFLLLVGFLSVPVRCWSWVRVAALTCTGTRTTRQTNARVSATQDGQQLSKSEYPRFRRIPQIREKPRFRKPKGYWLDISNIEKELRDQWKYVNVTVEEQQPPPIPNETLLNYWKRHDLRSVIVQSGGRDYLAERLGGAFIIPGKWSEAKKNAWVKQLLATDPNLDPDLPPLSPQQLKSIGRRASSSSSGNVERWAHQSTRKTRGYWSSEIVVIQELYEYLNDRRSAQHLPAVWMPRSSELNKAGRNDLRQSIQRFGGSKLICRKAALIPFHEWQYIEGQYDLLLELRSYLDEYHDGDYTVFPSVSNLSDQGYEGLNRLIQYYGGKKFVASRFGMKYVRSLRNSGKSQEAFMSWGSFDLDFGINLLEFVRIENMKKNPPLRYPAMAMPSPKKLLASGEKGILLDEKIRIYGGYENVARRLGLAYFLPRR